MTGPMQPRLNPSPPLKGSFPLDHENVCKKYMLQYMMCLHDKDQKNDECRDEAQAYFTCRMNNNLMLKEEWVKLGYGNAPGQSDNSLK